MKTNKQLGIKISGTIFAEDGHTNINHDEFLDKFIEFVEKNNWLFGGGTKQIDEDGEVV
ncbi:50S ribosome-binding protein YggL [Shimazuella kribbensis]|uniref:50S ribosome-binding protein YggL n=1 Tax=Shimazuella kribbensis TaxID=139808 RepID=UPI000427F26F|nr:50S ribosome-binding protein YggL [Shimazuella kribbensis]